MSKYVTVEWLRPKRWEGFREKIVRSRVRGKIEEGKVTRAIWRGKLYKVKILSEKGQEWDAIDEISIPKNLQDGSSQAHDTPHGPTSVTTEKALPSGSCPEQPQIPPFTQASAVANTSTVATDTVSVSTVSRPCGSKAKSPRRRRCVAPVQNAALKDKADKQRIPGKPTSQNSGSNGSVSARMQRSTGSPPNTFQPPSAQLTTTTRSSDRLPGQDFKVSIHPDRKPAVEEKPTGGLPTGYCKPLVQPTAGPKMTTHVPTEPLRPISIHVSPPSPPPPTHPLAIPYPNYTEGRLFQQATSMPNAQHDDHRGRHPKLAEPVSSLGLLTTASAVTSQGMFQKWQTPIYPPRVWSATRLTESHRPQSLPNPQAFLASQDRTSHQPHPIQPTGPSTLFPNDVKPPHSFMKCSEESKPVVTWGQPPTAISKTSQLPITSVGNYQPPGHVSLPPKDFSLDQEMHNHPVLGPIEKRVADYVRELESKVSKLESGRNAPARCPLPDIFDEKDQALLGTDTYDREVCVSGHQYRTAWFRSKTGRELVLKLMSLILSEEEIGTSNYHGGYVLCGQGRVYKKALLGDPRFDTMVQHAQQYFPGCFEGKENAQDFRNSVNAKCRKTSEKLKKRPRDVQVYQVASSHSFAA